MKKETGSGPSAHYLLVDALLRRGHTVDFYAIKGYVQPDEFDVYSTYCYCSARSALADRVAAAVPEPVQRAVGPLLDQYLHRSHLAGVERTARARHASRPYDVFLFLDVPAQFELPGAPMVSWPQGPPQTEWAALRALRSQIVALCGVGLYAKLKVFYALKAWRARTEVPRSTITICGSEWARERFIAYGIASQSVYALPYPVDLDLFTPVPSRSSAPITFLWLGRMDPRKRLDLMLDAFALLLRERRDAYLRVVGRIGYARGYRRRLDDFPFPDHLAYTEHVDRAEVPPLIRGADVVVQPSENENFGFAVAEALCCGKPVVLGPTNGTADYVGEVGFLFRDYTAPALKEALAAAAFAVRTEAGALEKRARAQALRTFTVERITDRLETILAEAVRRHSARGQPARPS